MMVFLRLSAPLFIAWLLAGEVEAVDDEELLVPLDSIDEEHNGAIVAGDDGIHAHLRERGDAGNGRLGVMHLAKMHACLLRQNAELRSYFRVSVGQARGIKRVGVSCGL